MKSVFASGVAQHEVFTGFIEHFATRGEILAAGKRNTIKLFRHDDKVYAVKSFRKPNIFNAVAYGFLRKSKARRSFEFAQRLLELGIGTPAPIAYFEERGLLFGRSFYCSEYLVPDLLFKDLVAQPNYPDGETILRQFTKFSFDLHEKGVEFLDHTPGNTLIFKKDEGRYTFMLVDLNRMLFNRKLSFAQRMKNLCRLTPRRDMIVTMANEYAAHYKLPETRVFDLLWNCTCAFQKAFQRKKDIKRKLGLAKDS